MVTSRPVRHKDSRQAHYTKSGAIVSFMVNRLCLTEQDTLWEPCAGAGHLVDGVLRNTPRIAVRISEIDDVAVQALREKYQHCPNVSVHHEDALAVNEGTLFGASVVPFTRIIANPPFGAYQSPERRQQLKRRYPKLYVRETYGLLLNHSLSLLQHQGRLVFIIPDTFLWLNRHKELRRKLLSEATINEIALFPSKFFEGISFGYSGLCIVTLTKQKPVAGHAIRILTGFSSVNTLEQCIDSDNLSEHCLVTRIRQSDIAAKAEMEFVITNGGTGTVLSKRNIVALGDIADVRTGFYSGNDRRWLRKANETVPRSKPYRVVEADCVANEQADLSGFNDTKCFIPIVRGGAHPYVKPTLWFVDWSKSAVFEYTRKGRNAARFQNSKYYFREGIAVPMVASGMLTGALLEGRLFDQGIVGIFPRNPLMMLFLLGFFNSTIATSLVKDINPTANNSANYLKRIPIVIPSQNELSRIVPEVKRAIIAKRTTGSVPNEVAESVGTFYHNLWCG